MRGVFTLLVSTLLVACDDGLPMPTVWVEDPATARILVSLMPNSPVIQPWAHPLDSPLLTQRRMENLAEVLTLDPLSQGLILTRPDSKLSSSVSAASELGLWLAEAPFVPREPATFESWVTGSVLPALSVHPTLDEAIGPEYGESWLNRWNEIGVQLDQWDSILQSCETPLQLDAVTRRLQRTAPVDWLDCVEKLASEGD